MGGPGAHEDILAWRQEAGKGARCAGGSPSRHPLLGDGRDHNAPQGRVHLLVTAVQVLPGDVRLGAEEEEGLVHRNVPLGHAPSGPLTQGGPFLWDPGSSVFPPHSRQQAWQGGPSSLLQSLFFLFSCSSHFRKILDHQGWEGSLKSSGPTPSSYRCATWGPGREPIWSRSHSR